MSVVIDGVQSLPLPTQGLNYVSGHRRRPVAPTAHSRTQLSQWSSTASSRSHCQLKDSTMSVVIDGVQSLPLPTQGLNYLSGHRRRPVAPTAHSRTQLSQWSSTASSRSHCPLKDSTISVVIDGVQSLPLPTQGLNYLSGHRRSPVAPTAHSSTQLCQWSSTASSRSHCPLKDSTMSVVIDGVQSLPLPTQGINYVSGHRRRPVAPTAHSRTQLCQWSSTASSRSHCPLKDSTISVVIDGVQCDQ